MRRALPVCGRHVGVTPPQFRTSTRHPQPPLSAPREQRADARSLSCRVLRPALRTGWCGLRAGDFQAVLFVPRGVDCVCREEGIKRTAWKRRGHLPPSLFSPLSARLCERRHRTRTGRRRLALFRSRSTKRGLGQLGLQVRSRSLPRPTPTHPPQPHVVCVPCPLLPSPSLVALQTHRASQHVPCTDHSCARARARFVSRRRARLARRRRDSATAARLGAAAAAAQRVEPTAAAPELDRIMYCYAPMSNVPGP